MRHVCCFDFIMYDNVFIYVVHIWLGSHFWGLWSQSVGGNHSPFSGFVARKNLPCTIAWCKRFRTLKMKGSKMPNGRLGRPFVFENPWEPKGIHDHTITMRTAMDCIYSWYTLRLYLLYYNTSSSYVMCKIMVFSYAFWICMLNNSPTSWHVGNGDPGHPLVSGRMPSHQQSSRVFRGISQRRGKGHCVLQERFTPFLGIGTILVFHILSISLPILRLTNLTTSLERPKIICCFQCL